MAVVDKILIEVDGIPEQIPLAPSLARLLGLNCATFVSIESYGVFFFVVVVVVVVALTELLLGILANLATIDDSTALQIVTHAQIVPFVMSLLRPLEPTLSSTLQVFPFSAFG